MAPDALDAALNSLSDDEVTALLDRLNGLPRGFVSSPRSGPPLLDLKGPTGLASDPDASLGLVVEALGARIGFDPSP